MECVSMVQWVQCPSTTKKGLEPLPYGGATMEEDVQRTIERIDERIKELEDTKRVLMQTFGPRRRATVASDIPTPPTLPKTRRKEEIKELLRLKGPMAKADILKERPDIPEGTVSYVLNDDTMFQIVDGKWSLKEGGLKNDVTIERESQDPPF